MRAESLHYSATPRSVLHLAPGHWAGHMRIFHKECLALSQSGYDVELAAHTLEGESLDPSVRVRSLGPYGKSTLAWRVKERIRRCRTAYSLALGSEASLFHFHCPEFIPWAMRLRLKKKAPIVFDCMEDFEGYVRQRLGIPNALRGGIAAGTSQLLKIAARRCDAVIVADEGTGKFFRPHARKVVVVHNFPDLSVFPDPGPTLAPQEYDLVYHGSLPRYHLEAFLNIDEALLRRGYAAKWRLLGNMPNRDWFMSELENRRISERFHVTGLLPHGQVAREICKARMGIIPLPSLPKFQNNIPMKLFEFMALRMPVVLSDLPPSRVFVGDQRCALMVSPKDYDAYASAILSLAGNENLRKQMGASGRARVENEYNWKKESQKLLDLYVELLSESSR